MENFLKVGCNFTSEFLHYITSIDYAKYGVFVDEVYGSRYESSVLTARPSFRVPDIDRKAFQIYLAQLQTARIGFNYTLNTSYMGSKNEIIRAAPQIKDYIKFLVDSGVQTITVSLPLMAELIRDVNSHIGIEVSTIAHVETVTQIKLWKERYGVTKLCGSLAKNRDINFIRAESEYCSTHGITLTLLANEFCEYAIETPTCVSASSCIYRDHCYQLHSIGYSQFDHLPSDYPMGECIQGRRSGGAVWLKANFIRPEDICFYNQIGINHFKITGRTGSTNYIASVVNAYLNKKYSGNLLALWKHLETIPLDDESEYPLQCYISNQKLNGFLDFWFNNPQHICANEVCGETCRYCDEFYQRKVLEEG